LALRIAKYRESVFCNREMRSLGAVGKTLASMGDSEQPRVVPVMSLATSLASQIATHIRSEGLRAGDRLTERRLAEQFRVSRSPVRAAMKQRQEAGVLVAGERSGYQVVDVAAAARISDAPETDADEQIYLRIAHDRVSCPSGLPRTNSSAATISPRAAWPSFYAA
jgi:DNA-binding transcriptional MocR family regulator